MMRVGDSGYMSLADAVARPLSDKCFSSYPRARELAFSYQGPYGRNFNPVSDFLNLEILNSIDCREWYFVRYLTPSGGRVPEM